MPLLSLFYGLFAGIALFAAGLHLLVGLRRRPRDRVHLAFTLMTALIIGVILFDFRYRMATSATVALESFTLGISLIALTLAVFCWFVALYTGFRPRLLLAVLTTGLLIVAVVNLLLPYGVVYANVEDLKVETLPWGERFVTLIGAPSPWQVVNILLMVFIFAYAFYAAYLQTKAGQRRAGWTLVAGIAPIISATIFDFLIDFGIITSAISLYAISYIGLVIVMSSGLVDEVVRAGMLDRQLIANERRWRTLLEGLDQFVVGLNIRGDVDYVNPYFVEATGYPADEVVGKSSYQTFVPVHSRLEIKQAIGEMMESDLHRHYTTSLLIAGGEQRTVAWSNVRLRDVDGAVTGSLSIGSDVTEKLAAEAALANHQQELEKLVDIRTGELQSVNQALRQQHQAAERRRRMAEGLASIFGALNTDRPLGEILTYLSVHADQLLQSDASLVVNGIAPDCQIVASTVPVELRQSALLLCKSALKRTIDRGHPEGIADLPMASADAGVTDDGAAGGADLCPAYQSALVIPLYPQDSQQWGMLLYYRSRQEFGSEDLDNAVILQGQISLAIENAQLRGRMADQAVARERNRLSRDLHDSVTQNLYTISTLAEVMPELIESHPAELARAADNLRLLATGALAEMRTLLLELRPAALLETSLGDLLTQLVEGLQSRTRTQLTVTVMNDRIFPGDVQIALYRIAQEALNNVIKHAEAEQAVVGLYCEGSRAVLRIMDDGCGFIADESPADRFGLENLRERAHQIHAAYRCKTHPGKGTEITVEWIDRGVEEPVDNHLISDGVEANDSRPERG